MIVYPDENYNSWINEDDADEFFEYRLNADSWDACTNKEACLITAFRSLKELDLNLYFDDDNVLSDSYYTASEQAEILTALQEAQCEQALYEIETDPTCPQIDALNISGLSVRMSEKPQRYSLRATAILRAYIRSPVMQMMR